MDCYYAESTIIRINYNSNWIYEYKSSEWQWLLFLLLGGILVITVLYEDTVNNSIQPRPIIVAFRYGHSSGFISSLKNKKKHSIQSYNVHYTNMYLMKEYHGDRKSIFVP